MGGSRSRDKRDKKYKKRKRSESSDDDSDDDHSDSSSSSAKQERKKRKRRRHRRSDRSRRRSPSRGKRQRGGYGRAKDKREEFRFDSPPKDHELTKGIMAAAASIGGGMIANTSNIY